MTVADIHKVIAGWAPKEIAWERDNVGLQVGDMTASVRSILVCLDVTEEVIAEAKSRKANVIISHHPLLFRPQKMISPNDEIGRCIRALIMQDMNLYSAHTNLDFTKGGTSFALAEALGLQDVHFLHKSYRVAKKIVTFVPEESIDGVRQAMAAAGAGIIGDYDHCSFSSKGTGSFHAGESAHPAVGTTGKLERVPEVRLEMIVNEWNVQKVIEAMRAAHPYEEVAYDLYPLENISGDYGMGVIGTLRQPMRLDPFLKLIKRGLRSRALRHTGRPGGMIRRVAACGGSGAELMDVAIAEQADAFITADVKYHDFHRANGKILLIDAGHYETEHVVVNAVAQRLKSEFEKLGERIPVASAKTSTNPIFYS